MVKFVRNNMKLIDFYQGVILDSGLDWGLATYKAIEKAAWDAGLFVPDAMKNIPCPVENPDKFDEWWTNV